MSGYHKLLSSSPATQWPDSSSVNWHQGDYIFVLFPIHSEKSNNRLSFIRRWLVPDLVFSIPVYEQIDVETRIHAEMTRLVEYAGQLINHNINLSKDVSIRSIVRLFWSLCLPAFALLHLWIMFNPPHRDIIGFIPIWVAINVVIFGPLILAYRSKKRLSRAVIQCNESLSSRYGLSAEQKDSLFMFLQYNSAHQICVVMAIKHQLIASLAAVNVNEPDCIIDAPSDEDESLDLRSVRKETYVCVPVMEERLDKYFQDNIKAWKDRLAAPHSFLTTIMVYLIVGINRFLSALVPCDPDISHRSAYSRALSAVVTEESYNNLTNQVSRSMQMGLVTFVLACCVPFLILTLIYLVLSDTLELSFNSWEAVGRSFALLSLGLVPHFINKLIRSFMEARIRSVVDYFNSEHGDNSVKLLYRYVGYRHLQLYMLVRLHEVVVSPHEQQLPASEIFSDNKLTNQSANPQTLSTVIDSQLEASQ